MHSLTNFRKKRYLLTLPYCFSLQKAIGPDHLLSAINVIEILKFSLNFKSGLGHLQSNQRQKCLDFF